MISEAPVRVAECPPLGLGGTPSICGKAQSHLRSTIFKRINGGYKNRIRGIEKVVVRYFLKSSRFERDVIFFKLTFFVSLHLLHLLLSCLLSSSVLLLFFISLHLHLHLLLLRHVIHLLLLFSSCLIHYHLVYSNFSIKFKLITNK